MAFAVGAFQVDAFQIGDAVGVIVEPPVVPPPPTGGAMPGRSGRWVRVDDGSVVHLPAQDCTAYALLDRPAVGIAHLDLVAEALLDRPTVGLLARLSCDSVEVVAFGDRPAVGRDDLPEVARLLKMTEKAPKPAPSREVSRIWALIDALRGKKS